MIFYRKNEPGLRVLRFKMLLVGLWVPHLGSASLKIFVNTLNLSNVFFLIFGLEMSKGSFFSSLNKLWAGEALIS